MDITRVSEKLAAFRCDYPAKEYGLMQSFTEDDVGGVARVVGCTQVVEVETGRVLAQAYGTRALRAPVPGAQGAKDTRDPDRAMTQSLGRVLGLMGYADPKSIEGDTDEPDQTNVTAAVPRPPSPVAVAKLHLAGTPPVADPDLVSTDALKETLNALAPGTRGKLKAALAKAGHPTEIPDMMRRVDYDRLDYVLPDLIQKVLDDTHTAD
tara:strand:- start:342 stop:968 length:627 start_codon:yes stop_codon:yes gene_type:complete